MANDIMRNTYRDLINANHILHYHNVLDAYGHVSVRHPEKHDVYIMSGKLAPGVVESPDDLIEYHISDSTPVDPNAKTGYLERFIHGEVFKRFAGVNCVIHSHSEDVQPYLIADIPLRSVSHMAGFLGSGVPTFDIVPLYSDNDPQDMLVRSVRFGAGLAATFSRETDLPDSDSGLPDHSVALMRRHGFTNVGVDIPEAVYRAIYTCFNARILTSSFNLRSAAMNGRTADQVKEIHYLTPTMSSDCSKEIIHSLYKPWRMWVKEVESSPLYKNTA